MRNPIHLTGNTQHGFYFAHASRKGEILEYKIGKVSNLKTIVISRQDGILNNKGDKTSHKSASIKNL